MRVGLVPTLASFVLLAACASTQKVQGGADSPVQLQVPDYLAWDLDGPFEVPISIVNCTPMILMAVEIRPESSDVSIMDSTGKVVCKTPRAVEKVYEQWRVKALQVGQRWELKRDIREYCQNLGPGAYRYEVNYRLNSSETALRSQYVAFLGPISGKLLVQRDATAMKYEDLVAVLDNPGLLDGAAAEAGAGEPAPAAQAKDQPAPASGEAAPAGVEVSEIRACVDKELADRGLNAYGDPKGTKYADGKTPVDEFGRILYVASKNPSIRKACKVPMF